MNQELNKTDSQKRENAIYFPGLIEDQKNIITNIFQQLSPHIDNYSCSISSFTPTGSHTNVFYADLNLTNKEKISKIIEIIAGLKLYSFSTNQENENTIQYSVCTASQVNDELLSLQTKTVKLIITFCEKGETIDWNQVQNYIQTLARNRQWLNPNIYIINDNNLPKEIVIDFEDEESAKKALVDLSCLYINKTFPIVSLKIPDTDQQTQKQKRDELFKRIGNDGIRMKIRKAISKYITEFHYAQILQLMPSNDATQTPNYNRFYGLLLMLFQFDILYESDYTVFIESFDPDIQHGSIVGTITINKKTIGENESTTKLLNAFKKQSIMKLMAFCVHVSSNPETYRFTTTWYAKDQNKKYMK